MKLSHIFSFITAAIILMASAASADAQERRWIGVMAVQESPLVNAAIRDAGSDPAVYFHTIREMLRAGTVSSATGRYCFIPYAGGQPAEDSQCFNIRQRDNGFYTMWAPAEFVSPGRAMCVLVPHNWLAIAGQTRYPAAGGRQVNCRDFGPEATGDFASSRQDAAYVVVVEALN